MYGNITDLSIVIETVENKDELIPNVNIPDRILNEDISKIIAICSPNFVQIGKGRDRKTLFCKVIHKKMSRNVEPKARHFFFMSNPVKFENT